TEMSERLAAPGSVVAALRRLNRPTLQVAEVIAALGGHAERARLDRLLGATSPPSQEAVTGALNTLREHALLTADPTLRLVPAAAIWPNPLGLGTPVAEAMARWTAEDLRALAQNVGRKPATRRSDLLTQVIRDLRDGDRVCAVADRAPAEARNLLYQVAATGETVQDHDYFSPCRDRVRTPVQWGIAHGLLVRAGDGKPGLVMPAAVAVAL